MSIGPLSSAVFASGHNRLVRRCAQLLCMSGLLATISTFGVNYGGRLFSVSGFE